MCVLGSSRDFAIRVSQFIDPPRRSSASVGKIASNSGAGGTRQIPNRIQILSHRRKGGGYGVSLNETDTPFNRRFAMTRTIRSLFAKALVGGALLAPFAAPAFAQTPAPQNNAVPQGQKKTAKELHAVLLKSTGWIQARDGNRTLSHGTGWILDAERKLMVTNDHVVGGKDEVFVVFPKYENGKLVLQQPLPCLVKDQIILPPNQGKQALKCFARSAGPPRRTRLT